MSLQFQLNESAGLAEVTLPRAKVTAYLSESVCRARFTHDRQDASFRELLSSNARQIRAAVSRRHATSAQRVFVMRPTDF